MTPTPDLDGYIAAQLKKRAALGSLVVFHYHSALNYPEGTVLDPNTERPYDPAIEPESGSGRDIQEMTLSVAFRPNFQEDTDEQQVGNFKNNVALTWVTVEEWETDAGEGLPLATPESFDYNGDNYLVRKTTQEGIGGQPWRVLIWGERQTGAGAV